MVLDLRRNRRYVLSSVLVFASCVFPCVGHAAQPGRYAKATNDLPAVGLVKYTNAVFNAAVNWAEGDFTDVDGLPVSRDATGKVRAEAKVVTGLSALLVQDPANGLYVTGTIVEKDPNANPGVHTVGPTQAIARRTIPFTDTAIAKATGYAVASGKREVEDGKIKSMSARLGHSVSSRSPGGASYGLADSGTDPFVMEPQDSTGHARLRIDLNVDWPGDSAAVFADSLPYFAITDSVSDPTSAYAYYETHYRAVTNIPGLHNLFDLKFVGRSDQTGIQVTFTSDDATIAANPPTFLFDSPAPHVYVLRNETRKFEVTFDVPAGALGSDLLGPIGLALDVFRTDSGYVAVNSPEAMVDSAGSLSLPSGVATADSARVCNVGAVSDTLLLRIYDQQGWIVGGPKEQQFHVVAGECSPYLHYSLQPPTNCSGLQDSVFFWASPLDIPEVADARVRVATCQSLVAVADPAPGVASIRGIAPNPAPGSVHIRCSLPASGTWKLALFRADGRLVRVLGQGASEPGERTFVWDGRDGTGSRVGPGIYFARLESDQGAKSATLVLLRPR